MAEFYKEKVINIPLYLIGNNFFEIYEKGKDYIWGEKWLRNVLIYSGDDFILDPVYGFLSCE